MTTIEAHTGSDTWVNDAHPAKPYQGGTSIRLQASHRRGYIHIPVTDVRGRTVLSATLTGRVRSGFVAQTITVAAVSSSWSAGKTTWNRQPTVSGTVATTLGALSDGQAADLDVTALVQSVANGAKWRGLRLSTDATAVDTSNWYSFDAAGDSWELVVELSDAPEQPSDLRPNIGAIASAKPVLAWSYVDLGGDTSEQGAFKVQIDPDADETSPAFDSGWVTFGDPEYDLSTSAYAGLALHAATQWRVMTRDLSGEESVWSDWATFSYEPYPTLTMDSPTGGVIGDATPEIVGHLTGETLTQWWTAVEDAAGNELWNSGVNDGALDISVPLRTGPGKWGNKVIATDDASYDIVARAWGDVPRAVAVGMPAYVEQRVTVVWDEDAGVTVPDSFTAAAVAAGDPRIRFTWHRTTAPDAVLILDADGTVFARLDSDDWTVAAGNYTWVDNGRSQPFKVHHFTIRAVESGVRSAASAAVAYTSTPEGVWIIADGEDPVVLDGTLTGFTKNDRRGIYSSPNTGVDIDIVTGLEGVSGHFDGPLWEAPDRDVQAAVATIERIRQDIDATPQLVWATMSIPVTLRRLSALPDGDNFDADNLAHTCSFDFIQAGD